ncbi:MAG: rod shape-determining protein RodA [bacterium]
MISRVYLRRVDFPLMFSALALTGAGLTVLYSLGRRPWDAAGMTYFNQQAVWFCAAAVAAVACLALDYRFWGRISWILYAANIILLAALILFGETTRGAERWFRLGPVKAQPSEFAKLIFAVAFADFLARRAGESGARMLATSAAYFIAPFGLILLQPDFGTALVFAAIFFGMLFAGGVEVVKIGALAAAMAAGAGAAAPFVIRGYQLRRLFSFLNPGIDVQGAGYQLAQSKTAIGAGHVFGGGLLGGTQSSLGYLPAAHTDFIFAALCEKAGFAGGAAVIALLCFFLYRLVIISLQAEEAFATYIVAGVLVMVASQAGINLAMTVGLFPITGVPLPFVSYGGSSLVTTFAAVGLVLNVCVRRRRIMFL